MTALTLTVIIPAFNEPGIWKTIESVLAQSKRPDQIIVVDDCSTDTTGELAQLYVSQGVKVIRPPENLGSKAKAQNFALPSVDTDLVLPIDADTILAVDYVEKMLPAFSDPKVAVAAGCVLTQQQKTLWEKARQLEYLLGFHWYRSVQQQYGSPTVCSGCCTVFRREFIDERGFPETTLTEDIFFTWTKYIEGLKAVYIHDAVAYAAEPETYTYMSKQLRRWKCGWFHGFRLQYLQLLRRRRMVTLWISLQFLETVLAPIVMTLPFLAYFVWHSEPSQIAMWWLLGDLIAFWPPVLYGCWKRKYSPLRAVASYPAWYLLKLVNFRWDMHMLVRELMLVPLRICKPITVYERGKA